jgi:membrane protein required for colicin V production
LLNYVDIAIVAIIALSAIVGLFRGLVREILSLVGWIFSIWIAWHYADQAAPLFASLIESADVRKAAAFVALFLLALVAFAVLSHLLVKLITSSALKGADRTLGLLFGALRGALIVAVLALLVQSMPLANEPLWQGSILKSYFLDMAGYVISLLPPSVGRFFGQSV